MAKNVNDKKIKQEPPKKLDDGLTKSGRRTRNTALKTAAMEKALAADLPWDESIKAARFFEDPDAAYLEATTSVKAIPAAVIIAKQKEISAGIEAANAEYAAKKAAEATANEDKSSTQSLAEAAKAALIGNTANDNTEVATAEMEMKPDEPSEETPAEERVETTETTQDEQTPTETQAEVQTDATDAPVVNPRERQPGESGKKYSQRIHKLDLEERRLKKAAKAAEAVAAATETRNGEPVVEGDAGLAQADLPIQTEKRYPTGTLISHSDYDGKSVQLPVTATQAEDEIKVSDELAEHGSFAAVAAAEKAEESKPVEIPAEEAPAETEAPVQTEPEATPEPGPVEAKTTKKTLTLVSNNPKPTRSVETVTAAKKFYRAAWSDERAADLTDAFHWLTCAIAEEAAGSDLLSGKGKLYVLQALKKEADAFSVGMAMAA